ncbi:MAG: DUF433 domain-containing protein [Acidobacteriota bacterium]
MAAITDIGTLIENAPEIRGGKPCLAGTGVTVQRVVAWYQSGDSPEEIADRFGHLSLAQVHAALAYYHANRDEIDECLAAEETEAQAMEDVQARKDLDDVKNFHESLMQRLDEPTLPAIEVYTRILNKIDAAAKA